MAQLVRGLPCKGEELSSDVWNSREKAGTETTREKAGNDPRGGEWEIGN